MAHPAGLLIASGIASALVLLAVVQQLNLRVYRRVRPARVPPHVRVSVLVPARDEERNIEACLRSLLGEDGFEVIVLDDESRDATPSRIAALQREFPRLRSLRGEPLPDGWRGKNWACHQLARAATGDYLAFTDADTLHDGSIGGAVALAEESRADLLSLMPHQVTESWSERLLLPLMDFFFLTFFPAFVLARSENPRVSAANGQFLLFRRDAYDACGGHAAIRGSVIDDLALARRIREERRKLVIADGSAVVRCRMYRSLREIVNGFSKNLYAAVGGKPSSAIAIGLLLATLFVAPIAMFAFTLRAQWLVPFAIGLALRARTDARTRGVSFSTLLHPIAIAGAVALLLRSMLRALRGIPASWKGRSIEHSEF